TTRVSFANALRLVLVRAFVRSRLICLVSGRGDLRPKGLYEAVDVGSRVPQIEGADGCEVVHRLRYERTTGAQMRVRTLGAKPWSRPATAKLATRRLMSHSKGPGSVSSKSLTSKVKRRSGVAKTPKFERWASPQSCAYSPVRTPCARSAAIRA